MKKLVYVVTLAAIFAGMFASCASSKQEATGTLSSAVTEGTVVEADEADK